MKHLSIDIETADDKPTAAILSIGAYWFDPYPKQAIQGTGQFGRVQYEPGNEYNSMRAFYLNVSLDDEISRGFTWSQKTMEWWRAQTTEAKEALSTPQPVTSQAAFEALASWIGASKEADDFITWNHSTFDAPILNYHFRTLGIEHPWRYNRVLDLRTLLYMVTGFRSKVLIPRAKIEHHALYDAFEQAQLIQSLHWIVEHGSEGIVEELEALSAG